MLTPIDKLAYAARQGARVAWFMGHYFAARDFHAARSDGAPRPRPKGRTPSTERMLADMATLFRRDLANAEAGLYPLPADRDGPIRELIRRSRLFFADLPEATERRVNRRGDDIDGAAHAGALPDYYLQNFHYQTGGYLTEDSAALYDMQVEVLFSGTANAMRRQCLVPISACLKGRDQRRIRLLDVACGTGRFLRFVKEAWPRIDAAGVDLSEAYLAEARDHLAPYRAELIPGNAEALPMADASQDMVVSIYLFHELPPEARRRAASEFARVLAPGGLLVFMDSLQTGDVPDYDGLLEMFPVNFHEPYYESYIAEDLPALFAAAGLAVTESTPHFMSKLVVCEKA